jgi:hypothetical protein
MKIEVLRSNELNTGHLTTSTSETIKLNVVGISKRYFSSAFFDWKIFSKVYCLEYKKNIFII